MSQRSLPKTPRSKSSSCDPAAEEGLDELPVEENEILRDVEEELRVTDEGIHDSRKSSRAGGSYHQTSPPRSPAAAQSRIGSPPRSPAAPQSRAGSMAQSRPPSASASRVASFREPSCEDEPPTLPSPPQSTVTFGSRTAYSGQRGPSPEYGSAAPSRPVSFYNAPQSAQCSPSKTASHTYSNTGSARYSNKSGMSCGVGNAEEYEGEVVEGPSYSSYMPPVTSSGAIRCGGISGASGVNYASSGAVTSGMCSPGCKKYRMEPQEPQEASEAPSFGTRGSEHPSARSFEDKRSPCGFTDRKTPCGFTEQKTPCGFTEQKTPCGFTEQKTPCGFSERTRGGPPTTIEGPPAYSSPRQPVHAHHTPRPLSPNFDRPHHPPGHVHETPMKSPQLMRGPEKSMTAGVGAKHSSHHHHHHHEGHEDMNPMEELDERAVSALTHLSQLQRTPSYMQCGLNQGLEFLNTCCQHKGGKKKERVTNLPEKPSLRQEEIQQLICCEAQDVESTRYLTSDERKTYKKPCPKQQKAKMSVKALVQAHSQAPSCQKEYSPLEHPDPEDISPEVAAAMMFSQERGIKMEECPYDTIASLFPDEPKPPFPEKIPQSSVSVVDRSSKDQEEMIEKSASVPSEGVSDSAYTRRMKGRGEDMGPQRSFDVDFAIGQSKREYILVAQTPQRINKIQYRGGNPPPWFPGYFSAFPNDEGIKMVSSPSSILNTAWIHSNPKNVPTSDVIVLD